MSETHGTVHWTELNTHDVDKAIAYYGKVCGWTFDKMPMDEGDYYIAMKGEQMIAGVFDLAQMPQMKDLPSHWLTYLAVDDVDAATKQTAEMGGTVVREPWDVDGVGRIAIVMDPSGSGLGLMTPS